MLDDIEQNGVVYEVTYYGKPRAVLVPMSMYETLTSMDRLNAEKKKSSDPSI